MISKLSLYFPDTDHHLLQTHQLVYLRIARGIWSRCRILSFRKDSQSGRDPRYDKREEHRGSVVENLLASGAVHHRD
jgi:hypothetical protein